MSYSVLMTAYNEEALLEKSLDSIFNQTIKPKTVVIVNDGSTDGTAQIIKKYPVISIIVTDEKYSLASFNMVRALNRGYKLLKNVDFEYVLKIDADAELPPHYVETCISVMEKNPKLGITSGNIAGQKIWSHRCSDGARLYRKTCFEDIEGLDFIVHWDTHAILKAYKKGWLVRTIYSLEYIELRTHERSNWYDWYVSGVARHYHGFPIYHTASVMMIRLKDKPPLGSIVMFITFMIYTTLRKIETNDYREYAKTFSAMELKHRRNEVLKNF